MNAKLLMCPRCGRNPANRSASSTTALCEACKADLGRTPYYQVRSLPPDYMPNLDPPPHLQFTATDAILHIIFGLAIGFAVGAFIGSYL